MIVTSNLRDFPPATLTPLGIAAVQPDASVARLLDLTPAKVVDAVRAQATALRSSPTTSHDLVARVAAAGLTVAAARLRTMV